MGIKIKSNEVFHLTLAALGEAWEYGADHPVGDPSDPEGLVSMDPHLFTRTLNAARRNDVQTLRSLAVG